VCSSDLNKNSKIKFIFPCEGASLWVDVAAIPTAAKHLNNVYAFFRFLFHPRIMAFITNRTYRANAVVASAKFVHKKLIENSNIYPSAQIRKKCYLEKPMSPQIEALKTRLLTKIKSSQD
jgi:putrescine transport system substrate-binding protein